MQVEEKTIIMNDYNYINSSDVRKNFSETINNAIYSKPQLIRRNRNDVLLVGKDLVFNMLEKLRINVRLIKDDNTYFTQNDVMEDIIGWGNTQEEAIDDFINNLDVYAHEYYSNFEFYSKTERGKNDLPYIFRIICSTSIDDVKGMLICRNGKN